MNANKFESKSLT